MAVPGKSLNDILGVMTHQSRTSCLWLNSCWMDFISVLINHYLVSHWICH